MCSDGAPRQAHALAQPVDQQQRRDLADAGLDRRQPDQLAIELRRALLDADGLESARRSTSSVGAGASISIG